MTSTQKKNLFIATILGVFLFAAPAISHADAVASGISMIGGVTGGIVAFLVSPIIGAILKITSFILLISGVALNATVYYTIMLMAKNFSSIGAIDQTWAVIRDIANMGFIFVLLYTAIMTIFGKGDYRKVITNMVVAALLINFSLFFTKVVIDAANMLAVVFYKAIAPNVQVDPTNFLNGGISNAIMDRLGLTNIWEISSSQGFSPKNFVTMGLMASIIQLVAAFSFAAVALLLIVRYVVLIFILILSPIFFISDVIPNTSKYADQWKKTLTGQAFFAPVYFLLLWISLQVIDGVLEVSRATKPLSDSLGGSGGYSPDMINNLFNFGVALGFVIFSLIAAKGVANSAGGAVSKITKSAMGYAGGATLGNAARIGRGTLGRFGAGVASSERVKSAIERGGVAGAAGRLAMAAGQKSASSSWDLRGTALGGSLDGGKPKKKASFNEDAKTRQKAAGDRAKLLKADDAAKKRYEENERIARERLEALRNDAGSRPEDIARAETEYNRVVELRQRALGDKAAGIASRSERYANKQSQPGVKLPDSVVAKIPGRGGEVARAISERGIGGAIANSDTARSAAGAVRSMATRTSSFAGEGGWNRAAKPLAWLAEAVATGVESGVRTAGLRQEERDAIAAAARKALQDKPRDQKIAELVAEAEAEKKQAEGGGETDQGGEEEEKKPAAE